MRPALALPETGRIWRLPEPEGAQPQLGPQPLMGLPALVYLYRRRLRVHAVQELLAGVGVAIAVALVFATIVAAGSIAGSADEVAHEVAGPATLQLHARTVGGFPEALLARVEGLPGVKRAAPLLEQTATIEAAHGRGVTVDLAGTDTSLAVLDGLAHTLPRAALSSSGIGLSRRSARELGIAPAQARAGGVFVTLLLRGRAIRLNVSAVLGPETFGALSGARVAVMRLERLQALAHLRARVTRVLVQPARGAQARVRRELAAVAEGRIDVAPAEQDVALLREALHPSDQASALFAALSALLGVLLAFTALLLTVPERRRAIADLRLIGTKRSAIVQMVVFQALCLGAAASLAGLACGYALSRLLLPSAPRYLSEAFTLGGGTVVGARPLLWALGAGLLAACLGSATPLLDLRRGRALDAVYRERGAPGNTLPPYAHRVLAPCALALLAAAGGLFAASPAHALLACVLLALAAVLGTPLALAAVVRAARWLSARLVRLTLLQVALSSLRAAPLRSVALAATGAVALFGSVALGGARGDLLRGVERFARDYSGEADVWVGNPGDNQATVPFDDPGLAGRLARVRGVAAVSSFYGGFAQLDGRRVWAIGRPSAALGTMLRGQIRGASLRVALARLSQPSAVVVSEQIARARHVGVGGTLTVPTPGGPVAVRIAATATNLAWTPGAIVMSAANYRRLWSTRTPTALGVRVSAGTNVARAQRAIGAALAGTGGLVAVTARQRERSIDVLTGEGLHQIGEISTLLLIAAILAMAAALASAIWQRRVSLVGLRLTGVRPRRLRLILLCESALMLGAGCLTGALAGVCGQLVIDGYLRDVTGFPLVALSAGVRPLEVFGLVSAVVLALAATPGWLASRVPPTLAFDE